MSYEFALPLHITGLTATTISNTLLPAGWLLSLEFFLLTSNPASIDTASQSWKDASKHVDDFKKKLETAKKLSADYWSGDDQTQVSNQITALENELDKLKHGIDRGSLVLEIIAIVFVVISILVFTVGLIIFALFLLALAALTIPIIGEAIIAECNGLVATIEGFITPSLTKSKLALAEAGGVIAYVMSAITSSVDFKLLAGGAPDPNFTQVVAPNLQLPPT